MRQVDWQENYGNWILVPDRPKAIIHFLGGAFVATAPQLTYRRLLEFFADRQYIIVATPFLNTFEHGDIAETVMGQFERSLVWLERKYGAGDLPIYGMGHSMGCKLHLLIGSLFEETDDLRSVGNQRVGNILISYNNSGAKDAIPMMDQMSNVMSQVMAQVQSQVKSQWGGSVTLDPRLGTMPEFSPSPRETNRLIAKHYNVPRNLLVKFSNDTIDQTLPLANILEDCFPRTITTQRLRGSHLTPLGQDLKLGVDLKSQAGFSSLFSSVDAISQFVRQEVFRELGLLEDAILRWLEPPVW
jgi:Protein of unknown function (DUF1350)